MVVIHFDDQELSRADKPDIRSQTHLRLRRRTEVDWWRFFDERAIMRAVPRLVQMKLLIDAFLLEVWEQAHPPAQKRVPLIIVDVCRQGAVVVTVGIQSPA